MKVIVVEMQGLHLGFLGCYGAEAAATTVFDRVAAEGVTFDQHFADCLDTAERTSWTGRYDFSFLEAAPPVARAPLPTLPGLLKNHGIPAKFLVLPPETAPADTDLADRLASQLDAALTVVTNLARQPHALIWVELPSLAPPWQVSPEEADAEACWLNPPDELGPDENDEQLRRLQDTYAAVLGLFDEELGRFLETLETAGHLEEVLLCLTARRGLALAERGLIGLHASCCHEEIVHLPLLLRLPEAAEPSRRVAALTQPVDLLPTLLEAVGVPRPADLHGQSLWPLLHDQADSVRPYAVAGVAHRGRAGLLLRTAEWAYLRSGNDDTPAPALFAKPDDRWEVTNLLQVYEPWAEHLDQTLRAFVKAASAPGPLCAPPLRELAAVLEEGAVPSRGPLETEATS